MAAQTITSAPQTEIVGGRLVLGDRYSAVDTWSDGGFQNVRHVNPFRVFPMFDAHSLTQAVQS